ncbi:DUF1566 domain-containing protein, partial [Winogradskyella sp.]|nr:DUF1566 domain-containing protein [Winogradskyella sp.]
DVNQNETDSDTADTTLQTNINTLTSTVNTNATTAANATALKEDAANKSTDVTTDGASDVKFPTVKSVKTYVDTEITATSGTSATALAALQADVDQNEADSDTAETTLQTNLALKANIASPTFTGTPLAPTAAAGTNTTQLATTAFVSEAFDTVISDGVAAQTLTIGDFVGGGVVFWVDPVDNSKGLVSSIEDQSNDIQWYNGSSLTTGATGTAVETGASNTDAIIAIQGATETNYAAGIARAYNGGGFTDWFLPSKDELKQMSLNRNTINNSATTNGGVSFGGGSSSYWSSTETGSSAWALFFGNAHQQPFSKSTTRRVRAVRAVGFPAISSLTTITEEQAAQNAAIALKEDAANKSTDVITDGASDVKFPTVKSVKTYVDAEITATSGNSSTALAALQADVNQNETDSDTAEATLQTNLNTLTSTVNTNATNTTTALNLKANIASPTFTGAPLAPTAAAGTSTTQLATTAFVTNAVSTSGNDFVKLTTNQTIAGNKSFSSDGRFNELTIGRGSGNNATNTVVGRLALANNTSGSENVAIGREALHRNTTGNANTVVGLGAVYYATSSSAITAFGKSALHAEQGSGNTAIGHEAAARGAVSATLTNSTFLGRNATASNGTIDNATAIGSGATVNASNTIQLGNTNITNVKTSGTLTANGFVKSGGTATQFLMADGSVSTGAAAVREVADEFTATTSQTSFTLTQTPSTNSKVKMYVNGIRISNSAYSWSGTTLTYNAANNGNYTLSASDRIQFDYYY